MALEKLLCSPDVLPPQILLSSLSTKYYWIHLYFPPTTIGSNFPQNTMEVTLPCHLKFYCIHYPSTTGSNIPENTTGSTPFPPKFYCNQSPTNTRYSFPQNTTGSSSVSPQILLHSFPRLLMDQISRRIILAEYYWVHFHVHSNPLHLLLLDQLSPEYYWIHFKQCLYIVVQ